MPGVFVLHKCWLLLCRSKPRLVLPWTTILAINKYHWQHQYRSLSALCNSISNLTKTLGNIIISVYQWIKLRVLRAYVQCQAVGKLADLEVIPSFACPQSLCCWKKLKNFLSFKVYETYFLDGRCYRLNYVCLPQTPFMLKPQLPVLLYLEKGSLRRQLG